MQEIQYPITATFIDEISYDMPSSNWSKKQWSKEFDYMKAVGIDTVVLIRGGFYGRTLFPCKGFAYIPNDDFVGRLLYETEKRGMKFFMGLYISNLNWNKGDYHGELEKNKIFIEEFLGRYGKSPSFCGWYIPHEQSHEVYNLGNTIASLAVYCKERTPEKVVFISPFYKTEITSGEPHSPEVFYAEWDKLFEKFGKYVDICAFQDGTAPLDRLAEYLEFTKKLCDKYGVELWSNVETFERDVRRQYPPIAFEFLREKIQIAKPFVKKCITFEFSHFLSPQSIYPSARNLNALYQEYYGGKRK